MRSFKSKLDDEKYPTLFPIESNRLTKKPRTFNRIDHPIWSHSKAQFIAQYLQYFVQITKHGAYIDGFAGPQYPDQLKAWTASQVLASKPKWLRQFFLCELAPQSVNHLETLRAGQPPIFDKKGRLLPRQISIYPGDFNITIDKLLKNERLTQKEATFCLLDQRTFECHWSTLEKIAAFKKKPYNKIELLYFLGVGWIHRAMSGLTDYSQMEPWWGRSDWASLPDLSCYDMANLVCERFKGELGYKFTAAYPIYSREDNNHVMYYMIHASDHEEAPALMVRAHSKAVRALPKEKQGELWKSDEDAKNVR